MQKLRAPEPHDAEIFSQGSQTGIWESRTQYSEPGKTINYQPNLNMAPMIIYQPNLAMAAMDVWNFQLGTPQQPNNSESTWCTTATSDGFQFL